MFVIKVVAPKIEVTQGVEESVPYESVVGLYSTVFLHIEANLITLIKGGSVYELENPTTVIIPKDGKAYIMDAQGNTIDVYYPPLD